MVRILLLALALACAPPLPASGALGAQPAPTSDPRGWTPSQHPAITAEQVARVDSIFGRWADPAGPGAAVAVTRNGRVIYSQGYGSAQLEYGIPVTPVTPFHVASVSKQFTTFAVALLARDGLLHWDDPVGKHLPEFPDFGLPITLRQLAQHTGGVRDQWELVRMAGWRMDDVITHEQVMAMMARQRELNFEPGSEHLYSNMGYSLLAEVVARVSGMPFGEFLHHRVFLPLGMHRTHVHSDHRMVVPGRAYSYAPLPGGGWQNAVLSYANQGATSLFTTVEDLARWIAEFEEPVVGDPALWREMTERAVLTSGDTVPYALGLSVADFRGLRTVGHGGSDAGFRTQLLHFPDQRLGVVVFGNASTFNAGGTAREVASVFLEEQMAAAPSSGGGGGGGGAQGGPGGQQGDPPPPPPGELAAFTGTFYSPELDAWYRIRLEGDRLRLEHPRHPPALLTFAGDDRFRGGTLGTLVFQRNAQGQVEGFLAGGGRVRNLRFVRIEDPMR